VGSAFCWERCIIGFLRGGKDEEKKNAKKLSLAKETLTALDLQNVEPVAGTAAFCPKESAVICSVMHTCVSCQTTEA
jgi:hypothetical protein